MRARATRSITLPGVVPVRLDVTSHETIEAAAQRLQDVTLLVNNAGVLRGRGALAGGAVTRAREEIETNYLGPLALASAFAPILAKNEGGAILNVLSVMSWVSSPSSTTYSASKAAEWALTNGLRLELAPQGTQVVGLHVGLIRHGPGTRDRGTEDAAGGRRSHRARRRRGRQRGGARRRRQPRGEGRPVGEVNLRAISASVESAHPPRDEGTTMKSYIIGAARTPRGRGKAGKGALSGVHPQELLAQMLRALPSAGPASTANATSTTSSSAASRRSASRARTSRATPCSPPAGRSEVGGVDAQPLLRLGPPGRQLRRDGRRVRRAGARRRRRRREHVARRRWARRRRLDGDNLQAARARVPGAAGHQRRSHRDARGLHARATSTRSRSRSQQQGGARDRGEAASHRSLVRRDAIRRRHGRCSSATSTRAPTPRSKALGGARGRRSSQMGAAVVGPNGETLDQLALAALPRGEGDRARPHRGQLERHRRRRGGGRCSAPSEYVRGARSQAARAHPRDGDASAPSR